MKLSITLCGDNCDVAPFLEQRRYLGGAGALVIVKNELFCTTPKAKTANQ